MRATIERRLLVNYRVDPATLARVLPEPFRPWLVHDVGVAGICLIRLGRLRPAGLPGIVGTTTENAAHRIAVEWGSPAEPRRGVYIPRRDSSSRLTQLVGGRLFPGEHEHARFRVQESAGRYAVALTSDDGSTHVDVRAHDVAELPDDSVFGSLAAASSFFQAGSIGYSATRAGTTTDGVELRCPGWSMSPLAIERASSSFFDDSRAFPAGTVALDSAFVMRDLDTTWHAAAALTTRRHRDEVRASA
jgi:Uncharacterized conserved protein (COG2071)